MQSYRAALLMMCLLSAGSGVGLMAMWMSGNQKSENVESEPIYVTVTRFTDQLSSGVMMMQHMSSLVGIVTMMVGLINLCATFTGWISMYPRSMKDETLRGDQPELCYWCLEAGHYKKNCPACKAGKPKVAEAEVQFPAATCNAGTQHGDNPERSPDPPAMPTAISKRTRIYADGNDKVYFSRYGLCAHFTLRR